MSEFGKVTKTGWLFVREVLQPVILNLSRCGNVFIELEALHRICLKNSKEANSILVIVESLCVASIIVSEEFYSQQLLKSAFPPWSHFI